MSITYTKKIVSLTCYSQIASETDVVFTVNWLLVGVEENYTYKLSCAVAVPYVEGQPFTPYYELTENQVMAWIDEYTAPEMMTSYQKTVATGIEQQKEIVSPPLPWIPPMPPEPAISETIEIPVESV